MLPPLRSITYCVPLYHLPKIELDKELVFLCLLFSIDSEDQFDSFLLCLNTAQIIRYALDLCVKIIVLVRHMTCVIFWENFPALHCISNLLL